MFVLSNCVQDQCVYMRPICSWHAYINSHVGMESKHYTYFPYGTHVEIESFI